LRDSDHESWNNKAKINNFFRDTGKKQTIKKRLGCGICVQKDSVDNNISIPMGKSAYNIFANEIKKNESHNKIEILYKWNSLRTEEKVKYSLISEISKKDAKDFRKFAREYTANLVVRGGIEIDPVAAKKAAAKKWRKQKSTNEKTSSDPTLGNIE
jgi:hypothetical protein